MLANKIFGREFKKKKKPLITLVVMQGKARELFQVSDSTFGAHTTP
jgi:hypothetical protein